MLDTMLAVGPAVRALFDSAAATQIARDIGWAMVKAALAAAEAHADALRKLKLRTVR